MKKEHMVCINCTFWQAPYCQLKPYPVMIAPGPIPHNLELVYGWIEAMPVRHHCGQGSWKEKYEHLNLWHIVKWGEWEDEDQQPHVRSYHNQLIDRAEAIHAAKRRLMKEASEKNG